MPPQVSAFLSPVLLENEKLQIALGSRFLIHVCVVRYECEESFTTLNVDIRNHQNLLDSMEQYVKGDLLEGANAYHCEKCNKKVSC